MNEIIGDHKVIASLILLIVAMLLRWLVIRYLKQRPTDEEQLPKRWINRVKNATNFFIFVGLIVIWLFELRYFALSIAAFAVSLVIATREYIQCLLGSLYQTSTKLFVIGDWIKVGSHCGEVVSSDWLSTTLMEVDIDSNSYSYSGKTLVIPNNQFVTTAVTNLNFMRRYINHTFSIIRDAEPVNVVQAKSLLMDKAAQYCQPFSDVAQRYSSLIESRLGVTIGGPAASVRLSTTSLGKNVFEITIFCPTQEAVTIEQQLVEDFMTFWYGQLVKFPKQKAESDNGT
jgi:small-conductance mechanosensitive channel